MCKGDEKGCLEGEMWGEGRFLERFYFDLLTFSRVGDRDVWSVWKGGDNIRPLPNS